MQVDLVLRGGEGHVHALPLAWLELVADRLRQRFLPEQLPGELRIDLDPPG